MHVTLENPVDNVATNRGTSSENCCIAHLFAEFLAILLKFAWLLALDRSHRTARLADLQWHVSITAGVPWDGMGTLLFDDVDIASREDTLETCSFIPPSPPYSD